MRFTDLVSNFQHCLEIFTQRQKSYGDAIERSGVLGAAVEAHGIASRLRQLVILDPQHGRKNLDSVYDSFLDLANYSLIGMHMIETGNWEGTEEIVDNRDSSHLTR